MNGTLGFACGLIGSEDSDIRKEISLGSGNSFGQGGYLTLLAKDSPDSLAGAFILSATKDGWTTNTRLIGSPDGALRWEEKHIVRSVNGNTADINGNVSLDLNYLPLSGGKINGWLYFNGAVLASAYDDEYKETWLAAGDNFGQGGSISLYHKDSTKGNAGRFSLTATDGGNNTSSLVGTPDGSLSWNGSEILLPVGAVFAFAANSVPWGCLLCNGGAVSRTTYAKLFSVIGTTYGSGDGSTTFNLPNLTDRFIQGSNTAGTVKSAGLPNINGDSPNAIIRDGATNASSRGLFAFSSGYEAYIRRDGNSFVGESYLNFNAAKANTIYGNSDTVQPPALTMRYYIKF